MKQINRNTFKVLEEDRVLAKEKNWNKSHNTFIGNLGEIAAAMYLGIEWDTPEKAAIDLIDDYGTTYQIKTVQEGFSKRKHWLEDKTECIFERYLLCVISENEKFIHIEAELNTRIADLNSTIEVFNGKTLKFLNRKK